MDGPPDKKRKLNEDKEEEMDLYSDDDDDDDDDIDMDRNSGDDDDDGNKQKKAKRQKIKLREKYRDDEDFQALEAPPIEPSKANQFFDPIHFSEINLEKESRLRVTSKNKYEEQNAVDSEGEQLKHLNRTQIEKYLQTTANDKGFTVQAEVWSVIALGLNDHLKNLFDEMNKWRTLRMDQNEKMNGFKLEYDGIDSKQWMDALNRKYAQNEAMSEREDEIKALSEERADLEFKRMTRILSETEERRLDELKKKSAEIEKEDASSNAIGGGDFSFNFGSGGCRLMRADKFYVVDAINMMEHHQTKRSQSQLRQLSKLYLKAA